jgi:hypothetical protein
MTNHRNRVPWIAIAAAILAGAVATPVLGSAPFQGMQIEGGIPIDMTQMKAAVPLEIAASAIAFQPVDVTIEDDPKKSEKTVHLKLKYRNSSDRDYFMYSTANLLDATGQVVVTKSKKTKADDDDNASVSFKFKLPYASAERVKKVGFKFALEKD